MKKLIALLLISIFVGSSSVNLCNSFIEEDFISTSWLDNEEDSEENKVEKESEVEKEQPASMHICFAGKTIMGLNNFYIKQLQYLPSPYLAKNIIPPNVA